MLTCLLGMKMFSCLLCMECSLVYDGENIYFIDLSENVYLFTVCEKCSPVCRRWKCLGCGIRWRPTIRIIGWCAGLSSISRWGDSSRSGHANRDKYSWPFFITLRMHSRWPIRWPGYCYLHALEDHFPVNSSPSLVPSLLVKEVWDVGLLRSQANAGIEIRIQSMLRKLVYYDVCCKQFTQFSSGRS